MTQWSPYQQTIFNFIAHGKGHAIVRAVAGSGKTTTIVECTKRIPRGCTSVLLAFNKNIATELRDVVYVPTNGCMNLAATVNVVLYDRMAKGAK